MNKQNLKENKNYNIEEGKWVSLNDNMLLDIIGSFINFADEIEIPFEKFDYSKKTDLKKYYKNKFPKFTEEVIDILVKCSNEKIKGPDNGLNIQHKKTTINFD